MTPNDEQGQQTAAERRLEQHLAVLRDGPPAPPSLSRQVLRDARWQRAVRSPLLAVAHVAAAMADTIRLLVRGRSQ